VTQVLDQIVLPGASRANNPNWNQPTSEFLREEFVQRKLKPWFGRNCWWDDVACRVDWEGVIAGIRMCRCLRYVRMVRVIENVEARWDRILCIPPDIGHILCVDGIRR